MVTGIFMTTAPEAEVWSGALGPIQDGRVEAEGRAIGGSNDATVFAAGLSNTASMDGVEVFLPMTVRCPWGGMSAICVARDSTRSSFPRLR